MRTTGHNSQAIGGRIGATFDRLKTVESVDEMSHVGLQMRT